MTVEEFRTKLADSGNVQLVALSKIHTSQLKRLLDALIRANELNMDVLQLLRS